MSVSRPEPAEMVAWRVTKSRSSEPEPLGGDARVAGLVADRHPERSSGSSPAFSKTTFVVEVLVVVARGVGVGFVTSP